PRVCERVRACAQPACGVRWIHLGLDHALGAVIHCPHDRDRAPVLARDAREELAADRRCCCTFAHEEEAHTVAPSPLYVTKALASATSAWLNSAVPALPEACFARARFN